MMRQERVERWRVGVVVGVCGLGCGLADAQTGAGGLNGAGMVRGMFSGEAGEVGITPAGPVVASLSYDGSSSWGFRGQDFESVFDLYDTYVCEIFSIVSDAALGEFRSVGFGNGNPFAMTDLIVQIYGIEQLGDICDDGELPDILMRSVPGAGFYDGESGVTDFGGQCLPAGEYVLRWAADLNWTNFGAGLVFFGQGGAHDNGGGEPDDGFQSNPGNAFGMGECFDTVDGGLGLRTGVNFVLFGVSGDCTPCSQDPTGCGDWDGDGDSDGDDFFAYLDDFASGDGCADLDGDGDIDSLDLFFYLDRFVLAC